jgi:hypothetical protein
LRLDVAKYMRENSHLYCELGNYEEYGGFSAYCDLVATDGFFVEGNAEVSIRAYVSLSHFKNTF